MQERAHARGPLVWRDMDQKALDDAYDQLIYAPNRDLVLARIAAASGRTRAALGAPQRIAYGPSEHEALDIYRTLSAPALARRSIFSSMAAPGASAAPRPMRSSPSRSSAPARMPSFSISPMSTRPAAICFRCTGKSAARSRGCGATPKVSAATAAGFMSRRTRPARTFPPVRCRASPATAHRRKGASRTSATRRKAGCGRRRSFRRCATPRRSRG